MRKILFKALIAALLPIGLLSCYEDKSTGADKTIPAVVFDADAAPEMIFAAQGETITIDPRAAMDDGSPGDLSISWYFTYYNGWDELGIVMFEREDPVSTESVFTHLVTERPTLGGDAYLIMMVITDNRTGLVVNHMWQLSVISGFGEGLVVVYESDSGSDMAIIVDPLFTEYGDGDSRIMTDIYSSATGGPLDALPDRMIFTRNKGFWALSASSIYNIDNDDFTLTGQGGELFVDQSVTIDPSDIFVTTSHISTGLFAVNGGEIFGASIDEYSPGLFTVPGRGDYSISGPVAYYVDQSKSMHGSPVATFYNEQRGMFQLYTSLTENMVMGEVPMARTYAELGFTPGDGEPDPGNIQGMRSLCARNGYFNYFMHLLRETSTGNHYVYVLDGEGIEKIVDLSSLGLDAAIGFEFHPEYNVLYYWTSADLYAVYLGEAVMSAQRIFTAPSGENISCFTVYQQAKWTFAEEAGIDTNNRLLLVGTYGSGEGTLHAIPTRGNSGGVESSGTETFGGFGRIRCVTAQE